MLTNLNYLGLRNYIRIYRAVTIRYILETVSIEHKANSISLTVFMLV